MHSFDPYERITKISVVIAAALSLLTGCGEDTPAPPVLNDDPLRKNVEIVNISPDTNQTWPPPYKVDNMEAYEAFLKDLDRGEILLPNTNKFLHGTHAISVFFDGMPRNLRITERPDNMLLHWLFEKTEGAELRILMLCGPAHYGGNNGHRITFEWDTGSRTLLVWCGDP